MAQTPRFWFGEMEIEIEIETSGKIDHEIEFGTRGLLAEKIEGENFSGYKQQHVEISYFPQYKIKNSFLSIGLRYRLREVFNENEHNEIRIIPQFEHENIYSNYSILHEIRFEQRFTDSYVTRPRYELGVQKKLSEKFSAAALTTFLISYAPQQKPEYEQRFAVEMENYSLKGIELLFGFEYRLANYTADIGHEFFILAGASIEL